MVVQDGTASIVPSGGDGTKPQDSKASSAGHGISRSQGAAPHDPPHVAGTGDAKDVTCQVNIHWLNKKMFFQKKTFHKSGCPSDYPIQWL